MKFIRNISIWLLCLLIIGRSAVFAEDYDCAAGKHKYEVTIVQKATEDQEGIREYTCEICGYTYQEVIPSLGHSWSEWITDKEPTCSEEGHRYRICDKYPDSIHGEEEIIPATGKHDYKATVTEPTCTEKGMTTYTCSMCGDTYTDNYTDALGHDYVSEITLEPTEESEGIITYTCTRCKDTYTEVIPKLERQEETTVQETTAEETETAAEETTMENIMTPSDASENIDDNLPKIKSPGPNALDIVLPAASVGLSGWYVVLIYPYIMVLLWAKRKRKEAKEKMESQRDNGNKDM